MAEAILVAENLPNFCPITNHYMCDDGKYLLVTIPALDSVGSLELFGVRVPIAKSHMPTATDVFLADENAVVLDADGDPANGLTPLASFEVQSHEEALALLGYTLAL